MIILQIIVALFIWLKGPLTGYVFPLKLYSKSLTCIYVVTCKCNPHRGFVRNGNFKICRSSQLQKKVRRIADIYEIITFFYMKRHKFYDDFSTFFCIYFPLTKRVVRIIFREIGWSQVNWCTWGNVDNLGWTFTAGICSSKKKREWGKQNIKGIILQYNSFHVFNYSILFCN